MYLSHEIIQCTLIENQSSIIPLNNSKSRYQQEIFLSDIQRKMNEKNAKANHEKYFNNISYLFIMWGTPLGILSANLLANWQTC